jgi:hypothetical protein
LSRPSTASCLRRKGLEPDMKGITWRTGREEEGTATA